MADLLGLGDTGLNMPTVEITGLFSGSWTYFFIFLIIGLILVISTAFILFFMTYKKKIIVFENISGMGYQPVVKTRARILKLGIGGEEIFKTLSGGIYLSAYGKKMGKNTFWFAKGEDGYFYNIVLGDLDTKRAMLDVEPVDRDVRMFHAALDRLSNQTYNKPSFIERYGNTMLLFLYMCIFIFGMWYVFGQLKDVTTPLAAATENTIEIQKVNSEVIAKIDSLIRSLGYLPESVETGGSGLIPIE